jgi:hypothetical protein
VTMVPKSQQQESRQLGLALAWLGLALAWLGLASAWQQLVEIKHRRLHI